MACIASGATVVTVQASFGPDGEPVELPGAPLYVIDEDGEINDEQVVLLITD